MEFQPRIPTSQSGFVVQLSSPGGRGGLAVDAGVHHPVNHALLIKTVHQHGQFLDFLKLLLLLLHSLLKLRDLLGILALGLG